MATTCEYCGRHESFRHECEGCGAPAKRAGSPGGKGGIGEIVMVEGVPMRRRSPTDLFHTSAPSTSKVPDAKLMFVLT